jgi:uncharacterized UBP type Zn finger protein
MVKRTKPQTIDQSVVNLQAQRIEELEAQVKQCQQTINEYHDNLIKLELLKQALIYTLDNSNSSLKLWLSQHPDDPILNSIVERNETVLTKAKSEV